MQNIAPTKNSARKYYPGITLFKLIGSLLVVFAHIGLPQIYNQLNKSITGLNNYVAIVVPCFYVVSGFLAYQGWSNAKNPKQYVKNYLMWVISVYVLLFVFYALDYSITLLLHYGYIPHLIFSIAVNLFESFFIKGPNPALWFIPPLIFGVSFSYYFVSRNKLGLGIKLALAGFVLAQCISGIMRVVLESYVGHLYVLDNRYIKLILYIPFQYLGYGSMFVLCGVIIARYEESFLNMKVWRLLFITIATVAVEWLYLKHHVVGRFTYHLTFGMVPITILVMYGILHIKMKNIQPHHRFLNVFTIITYFCHIYFININFRAFGYDRNAVSPLQTLLCIFVTFSEAYLLTVLIFYLQRSFNIPIKKILSRAY